MQSIKMVNYIVDPALYRIWAIMLPPLCLLIICTICFHVWFQIFRLGLTNQITFSIFNNGMIEIGCSKERHVMRLVVSGPLTNPLHIISNNKMVVCTAIFI